MRRIVHLNHIVASVIILIINQDGIAVPTRALFKKASGANELHHPLRLFLDRTMTCVQYELGFLRRLIGIADSGEFHIIKQCLIV